MSTITTLVSQLASGQLRIIDLTNMLSSQTPTLELPPPFANLDDFSLSTVSKYDELGPMWQHANFSMGEHIGTHIDAPIHWVTGKDGKDVAQIEPERLVGPAVVLDFVDEATQDPDFLVDVEHIQAWEAEHGELPENSWVLFRTGWDKYAQDQKAFLNADDTGSHTPGFTVECCKWLANEKPISGIGVETVGIDAGRGAEQDPIFPMHYYFLGQDKYGITSLQNLAQLPPTGSMIMVAPLPIVGGTGSPCRVLALVEK